MMRNDEATISFATGFDRKRVAATMETFLRKTILASALAASTFAVALAPAADAQPHRHRVWVCRSEAHVRHHATAGTIVGALGGGLAGRAIGGDTTGALVGAGVGAVAGHQIAKHQAKRDCHWEYR
jgi:uncharacterized protein YcfJ